MAARLVAAAVVLMAGVVLADVIQLNDGRKLEGEIARETPESIFLKTPNGEVELFRSQIKEIEKKPLPAQVYAMKAASLAPDDAEGHYRLALWCGEHGLLQERREELRKTIELAPDHAPARQALGYVRRGDRWVKEKPEPPAPDYSGLLETIPALLRADPADAAGLVEKLRASDGMSKELFDRCADEMVRNWRTADPPLPAADGRPSPLSSCAVSVPESHDGKTPFPLLVCLHGRGQDATDLVRAWNSAPAWDRIKKECLVVAPSSQTALWWQPGHTGKLDILLREVKRLYRVDANRVYLMGFSNGAHGAWHYALRRPDVFAGILTDSGLPVATAGDRVDLASLQNAANLPVFVVNARDDRIAPAARTALVLSTLREYGCRDVACKELPEATHRPHAVDAWGEAYEWLRGRARDPFARRVRMYYDGTGPLHVCWLELVNPEPGATGTAEVGKDSVEITASGARGVCVFLCDQLLDLDGKVTVRLNNKRVFQGAPRRSAATMLETCLARNDPCFTYGVRLAFELK